MEAHTATQSFDCKQPGCTNAAKANRGPYSYCDEHRGSGARAKPERSEGSIVARLSSLTAAAKRVDRLRRRAEKLTRQALEAKRQADAAERDFAAQLAATVNGNAE